MKRFKDFIIETVRQGLPHIHSSTTAKGNQTPSLSTDQFAKTTQGGKVHIHHVTEKTDGQTFKIGYDEKGFYTQHYTMLFIKSMVNISLVIIKNISIIKQSIPDLHMT